MGLDVIMSCKLGMRGVLGGQATFKPKLRKYTYRPFDQSEFRQIYSGSVYPFVCTVAHARHQYPRLPSEASGWNIGKRNIYSQY